MDFFSRPIYLLLILPWLVLLIIYVKSDTEKGFFSIQSDRFSPKRKSSISSAKNRLKFSVDFFYFLALLLLIFATAGPGKKYNLRPNLVDGIDIMVALDISGSMVNSYDFLPKNRLSVSKELITKFIKLRKTDRIGLVLFAGAAYLQSPLTNDSFALSQIISEVYDDAIDEQGTAIGDAIVLSTYRLKNSSSPTKIIILITDGVSNTGKIDAETASFAAKAYNIKTYTIGIGKENGTYEVNYESLAKIAENTNGIFFRAESPEILEEVFYEIDQLEKSELQAKPLEIEESYFPNFLLYSFLSLIAAMFLKIFPYPEKI